ncbi:hypothetical protein IPF37_01560 [bacterium]|nr:MAG: hypothetical protein IPF37_01560 [bacterium]
MIATRFLSFFLVTLSLCSSCTFFAQKNVDDVKNESVQPFKSPSVFDSAGKLNTDLLSLLDLMNIQHDGSLADVVTKTQAQWLRQVGKERWEMPEFVVDQLDQFLSLLDRLGCITQVAPAQQHYDYALLLGATLARMRTRLGYLITLWNQGIRFDKLVLLGGQRILEKDFEGLDALLDRENIDLPIRKDWQFSGTLPTTEMQMMVLVYDQAEMPKEMRNVPVVMVDSPMRQRSDGMPTRPTTIDTITDWLKTSPLAGSCLVLSNQPFVQYQHSVVKTALPEQFFVETVGHAVEGENHHKAVYLDTVARWLYQENKRLGR